MHLREVHMENFKSFKGSLTVPFEPGFTAITGPNGSGKSNIGDAIMFVLGPTSPRAMRAKNLSELIFNGAADGKPADTAGVSLVFENADRTLPVEADTVTLTRRIKRAPKDDSPDGVHSYFYVNGRASQKKEFVELLQHARISADGYNIVLQGDVRQICLMTPVKRREILDAIAGVTSFDNDIAAASRRREEVDANLERTNIVLEELQRNLDQLDKEKASAQKYRDLQTAIKRTKGALAWRNKGGIEAAIAQEKTAMARFQGEREELAKKLEALAAKLKEAQAKFAEMEKRIRDEGGEEAQRLQTQITQAHGEMTRLDEKINFAKQELQSAEENAGPQATELRRIEKELAANQKAQADGAAATVEAQRKLKQAKGDLEAMRNALAQGDKSALQINRELAQLKVEHETKQTELHAAQLENDRLKERHGQHSDATRANDVESRAVETDLAETKAALKDSKSETGGAGKRKGDLEKRLFELKKAQGEAMRQAEDLNTRLTRLNREIGELRASEEAAARASGKLTGAVQDLLDARNKRTIKGIVGTVAELIKVEKRLEEAIRITAAGRLTAVVVEDDSVAQECIELVKAKRSGRVVILPLNKMVPGRPSGQALMAAKKPGCLGFAMDLVEYNERYHNAIWTVLQDTLLVDTMRNARLMMGGVRMATLDGELFERTGAMVGGKDNKKDEVQFTNADRGRMDELLQDAAKTAQAHEDAVAVAAKSGDEIVTVNQELAAFGAHDASRGDRLKELERKLITLTERLTELAEARKELGTEAKQLAKDEERLAEILTGHTERLAELERLRHEKGRLLLKGTTKEQKEQVEGLERSIQALTEESLKAEHRRDVAAKQIEIIEARRKELAGRTTGLADTQDKVAKTIKTLEAQKAKAKAEVEALLKMQSKAMGALKGVQETKDKAYQDAVDQRAKMDKVQEKMETTFQLYTKSQARVPALEEELAEALMDLKESPFEPAAGESVPVSEELKRELKNQEAQLERLGNVNMRALEEFEAQSTRRNELSTEVERLQNQKKDLLALIDEVSKRKKSAFMAVFERINRNVGEVYNQLSIGGRAYLKLENDDDPFQGGLTLMAQPPGKRVIRIELLSGGEQGIASMALIFAIQRDDPSTFYYLDEVDMNLDAVNSEHLARMVRDQSRFAQFIVVSLRKVTLKEASHIYGVTQAKPGESQIVARFDIDTLPDTDKDGATTGTDGDDLGGGDDAGSRGGTPGGGNGATLALKKKKPTPPKQAKKEVTLSQLGASLSSEVKA